VKSSAPSESYRFSPSQLEMQQRPDTLPIQAPCISSEYQPQAGHGKTPLPEKATITVSAHVAGSCGAIVRSDRAANESITSMAVTSTMMPCFMRGTGDPFHSGSLEQPLGCRVGQRPLNDAMRMGHCLRSYGSRARSALNEGLVSRLFAGAGDLVSPAAVGFFDTAMRSEGVIWKDPARSHQVSALSRGGGGGGWGGVESR